MRYCSNALAANRPARVFFVLFMSLLTLATFNNAVAQSKKDDEKPSKNRP